ncbi:carboxypeptidase regulatory-like domain-containing protein, partial [Arsenicibacter rosenii]|uniref:carboxypeptidase regulatory-like domain-containing protein n=1 Tax=Arsenicibacter rosenii TaxID=1750698 RepID=UPI00116067CC
MLTAVLLAGSLTISRAQMGPGGGGPPGFGGQQERQKKEFVPGFSDDAPKGNARITGIIVDSSAASPVEFASIALISQKTGKPVDGTVADAKGKFTLNKIAAGDYRLQYTFIGY